MADKIYRRTTQSSSILKSNDGKKERKRNIILNFRVTEQEKNLIEKRIELSGLKKSDYFIENCLYQKILVKGNICTLDLMKEQLARIADVLKEREKYGEKCYNSRSIIYRFSEIFSGRHSME